MVIHNTKMESPTKQGFYITFNIHKYDSVLGDKVEDVWVSEGLWSDVCGWVGSEPLAWAEKPTLEDVKGALYVTGK